MSESDITGTPELDGSATDAELAAWAPTCELCGAPNRRLPTGSWGCDQHSDWSQVDVDPTPTPTMAEPTRGARRGRRAAPRRRAS